MNTLSLDMFVDKVGEIMPSLSREFLKNQTIDFYKVKLTFPQCFMLDMLDRSGELNMTDLAKSMNVTTAAMTGVADRLVRDSYVVRASDPKDRRVIKIRLTVKGKKAVRMIHEHRRQMLLKLFGVLSVSERKEYLRLLTKIKEGVKG